MHLRTAMPLTALILPILFAPPEAHAGGTAAPQPVAEIVTFHRLPNTDKAVFLSAAKATAAPVAARPGFLRRSLSRDDTGLWTDCVEWADLQSAGAAAQAVLLPKVAPFMAAIDPNSVEINHRTILWTMGD